MLHAVAPDEFDGGFVRLRPAVAEEDALRKRITAQCRRQLRLGLGVIEVRSVDELLRLALDRTEHARMGMPQIVYRYACDEVEIPLAVGVPDMASFAANQGYGKTRVGIGDIGL